MNRRNFLKGLLAATVLAPIAARVAPPEILTASTMEQATRTTSTTTVTTTLSRYSEWIKISDLIAAPMSDNPNFEKAVAALSGEAGRMWGVRFTEKPTPRDLNAIPTNRGVSILGDRPVRPEGQWGFISYKLGGPRPNFQYSMTVPAEVMGEVQAVTPATEVTAASVKQIVDGLSGARSQPIRFNAYESEPPRGETWASLEARDGGRRVGTVRSDGVYLPDPPVDSKLTWKDV